MESKKTIELWLTQLNSESKFCFGKVNSFFILIFNVSLNVDKIEIISHLNKQSMVYHNDLSKTIKSTWNQLFMLL